MLIRTLAIAIATLLAARAHADHDLWYVMEMQGKRAGWMRSTETTDGDRIRTTSETRLTFKRGSESITITLQTEFVETLNHKPISMRQMQRYGTEPIEIVHTFTEADVQIVSTQHGRETRTTAPLPEGVWLTPAAAAAYDAQRLAAGAKEIVVRTIDPSMGLTPITITVKVLERTRVEAMGKTVPALRCESRNSLMPDIVSHDFIDEKGIPIRTTMDIGGLSITMLAAEREVALAAMDPPEIMASTMVKAEGRLPNPRRSSKASYLLSVPGDTLADLPSVGAQRVERIDARTLRVTIDLRSPAAASGDDAVRPAHTSPSAMIDSSDPEVRALAARATRGLPDDPRRRAEAMRRFVFDYIDEKSLGVGFASASETARCQEGDCSEHGTLLAAMLRADGIPSRVVSGLLYVEEFLGEKHVFGYHMWTQALLTIEGKPTWVDLDATFPPELSTDATHIALAVSAMADGEPQNALISLAPLLGRLRVKVESVE